MPDPCLSTIPTVQQARQCAVRSGFIKQLVKPVGERLVLTVTCVEPASPRISHTPDSGFPFITSTKEVCHTKLSIRHGSVSSDPSLLWASPLIYPQGKIRLVASRNITNFVNLNMIRC